jgi:hypothetical protein
VDRRKLLKQRHSQSCGTNLSNIFLPNFRAYNCDNCSCCVIDMQARNALWRSPTVSQAGSELSIDTFDDQSSSLNTPLTAGSGSFSFPQYDDVTGISPADDADTEHQRRQVEELHEQLLQMMRSSAHDDVTGSFAAQTTTKSSNYWSSQRTVTVTSTSSTRVKEVILSSTGGFAQLLICIL